jgi:type IX secretion system PorP/SprF family membrane protein
MKKNKITYLAALLAMVLSSLQSIAQFDPQFTQYMFNELYVNPAYAGSRDNLSGTGLIREQWVGLDGAPSTQTLTVHAPFADRKVGAGLSILRETIGVSKKLGVNLVGAYRIPMDKNTLSFGLQLGLASISENLQALDLTTDNQFQRNTGNKTAPNFGFGAYYQTPKWYAGLSIPRMLKNKLDVSNASTQVKNTLQASDFHYFLTGGSVHAISNAVKLRPAIMMKVVNGAPIELDLSCNALFRDFIWAGLAYRTGDAASLLLGAQLTQQFRIGYAYDYTLSQLQDFNSGSHELMLGFDFGFDKDRIVTPRYF